MEWLSRYYRRFVKKLFRPVKIRKFRKLTAKFKWKRKRFLRKNQFMKSFRVLGRFLRLFKRFRFHKFHKHLKIARFFKHPGLRVAKPFFWNFFYYAASKSYLNLNRRPKFYLYGHALKLRRSLILDIDLLSLNHIKFIMIDHILNRLIF